MLRSVPRRTVGGTARKPTRLLGFRVSSRKRVPCCKLIIRLPRQSSDVYFPVVGGKIEKTMEAAVGIACRHSVENPGTDHGSLLL